MLCYAALPEQSSFSDCCERISAYGFEELSLWENALEQGLSEQGSAPALRRFLADLGLRISILEFMKEWSEPSGGHVAEAELFAQRLQDLGSDYVMTGCLSSELTNSHKARIALREQCKIINAAGGSVALEFLPWTAIPNLSHAKQWQDALADCHLKLTFDTWHFARSGGDHELLEALAPDAIAIIQYSDAGDPARANDLFDDTLNKRLMPGVGSNDWNALRRALTRQNSSVLGPEIFNAELRAMDLDAALEQLAQSRAWINSLFDSDETSGRSVKTD